jgi:hypothetical protein
MCYDVVIECKEVLPTIKFMSLNFFKKEGGGWVPSRSEPKSRNSSNLPDLHSVNNSVWDPGCISRILIFIHPRFLT